MGALAREVRVGRLAVVVTTHYYDDPRAGALLSVATDGAARRPVDARRGRRSRQRAARPADGAAVVCTDGP